MKLRLLGALALSCLVPVMGACDPIEFKTDTVDETVSLDKNNISVYEYGSETLTISGKYENVIWSSQDTRIATVSDEGVVTGVSAGQVYIIANVDGTELFCKVTVTESKESTVAKFFRANYNNVVTDDNTGKVYYGYIDVKMTGDYINFQMVYSTTTYEIYYCPNNDFTSIAVTYSSQFESGKKYKYKASCAFFWNSFKSGMFDGSYEQETAVGSDQYGKFYVTFPNEHIYFGTDCKIYQPYEGVTYVTQQNDFSSVDGGIVLNIYNLLIECTNFAADVFEKFNSNLTLY